MKLDFPDVNLQSIQSLLKAFIGYKDPRTSSWKAAVDSNYMKFSVIELHLLFIRDEKITSNDVHYLAVNGLLICFDLTAKGV